MERTADNRIHTSEWEDVQYKYGNRVDKYASMELEILAQKLADKAQNTCLSVYDANEEKVDDKLERGGYECAEGKPETLETIMDSDDDDDALAAIRRKRLQEIQAQRARECFGVLRHIPGTDYVKEVTDSSEANWVAAALIKPGHSDSEALLNVLRVASQRNREMKFVSIVSTEAIPNFPDKHLPCVLLYHKRELQKQFTGLDTWKSGKDLNVRSVEKVLQRYSAIHRDDIEDGDE